MTGQRGFTLIEVLVATSVAAIGIVAVLELFSGSTRLAGAAVDQTQALAIGRSVMDQALWRVDLDEGTERGDVEEYHWTREVLPLEPSLGRSDKDDSHLGKKDEESDDFELKEILVVVTWKNAGGIEKEIRLSSARLMEKF